MKNFFKKLLIGMFTAGLLLTVTPFASAQNTILPKTASTDCYATITEFQKTGKMAEGKTADVLGCAINTGRVSLTMVPYFIQYFSNYMLGMVSLIALLFVVLGGFLYSLGGLTEQKDKGKAYIRNALIGMVTAFLAWSIVNVILAAITG